ncbi:MAG: DUF3500 domain-containing protein, partial [Planctomycetota bacterium]
NDLTEQQFRKALESETRRQIQAGPGRDNFAPKAKGICCSEMNEQQISYLRTLINAWLGNVPKNSARRQMIEFEKEFDQTYFAWHGSRKKGSDVSYVIQGPSLLIEFAYQDLGGDPLAHLHTQFRNLKNDYGKAH